METFTQFVQEETTKLLEKHGVIFAFNDKQFEAKKAPNTVYVSLGNGTLVPKKNVEAFLEEQPLLYEENVKNYLEKYGREEIILFELRNHEAFYTHDYTYTYEESLKSLGIREDEVRKVFGKHHR